MSRALVLGATGTVGSAIAEGLLSKGFVVSGLARSREAASQLLSKNVTPVLVSNAQDTAAWIGEAERSAVVVEALGDKGSKDTQRIVSEALIALRQRAPGVHVIFTSGIFSYGQDDRNRLRVFTESDDSYEFSCQASLSRHPIERAYRAAGVTVISLGMVYGAGEGPLLAVYGGIIRDAVEKNTAARLASVFGDGSQWLSSVHRRDVGELYALVASRAHELKGQLINGVAHFERFDAIVESVATAAGLPTEKISYYVPEVTDLKWRAYGANVRVSGQKARILGWTPRQASFCELVETEVAMWKSKAK